MRSRRIKGWPNEEEVDHTQAKEGQKTNDMSHYELRSSRNKIVITNSSHLIQFTVAIKTAMGEREGIEKEGEKS